MAKINPIQLQKYLKGVNYPASKRDLISSAEQNGADKEIRSKLERLPGERYGSPAEVSKAIGSIE